MNTAEKIEDNNTFKLSITRDGDKISYWIDDVAVHAADLVDHINYISEPKPTTLEGRVKAEYPDYDVVMLEFDDRNRWVMPDNYLHIDAQSMKGFYKYVYFDGSEFYTYREPTDEIAGKTITPIAVLFVRGEG